MKFLTALFLLLCVSAFGAVPAYTSFRGTGGILITSNPPTGNITIDGSGVFTTSGTNASVAISTNGVLVMAAATNVNFVKGTNVVITATNIGSTAHIGIHTLTDPADKTIAIRANGTIVSQVATQLNVVGGQNILILATNLPAGAVSLGVAVRNPMLLGSSGVEFGTWSDTAVGFSNSSSGVLSLGNLDPGSGDVWTFAGNATVLAMPGTGDFVGIGANGTLQKTNINDAVNVFLLTYVLPVLTVESATITNLGASPPISSVQYNSNNITRGSARFVFTNGLVGPQVGIGTGIPAAGSTLDATGHIYAADAIITNIVVAGQGVEVTAGSFVLNGGTTALVAWNGLGRIRWDADGVMRLENDAANSFNRVNFRGNTAASPALGVTNGDFIVLGGNGNFKIGGSTNKLIVPAVHIANDGGVGTPLLSLDNPLSAIRWDLAIDSNPQTYFLGLGRVGDGTPTMVWELGGNVGINTTNPATTLDVNGRFRASTNVYFPGLLSNALPVAFLAVDSGGEVYETAIPTVTASPDTNAVLTNLIGTVARNVTNVVSLSTTNATSKPLTNSYANGVLTLPGIEAGANVTITANGSNYVIASTASGGGGAGSLAVNDNQFVTNALLNLKDGALTTNVVTYGLLATNQTPTGPTAAFYASNNPTPTLWLGSNGFVGIRTNAPLNPLQVHGNIFASGSGSYISSAAGFYANDGANGFWTGPLFRLTDTSVITWVSTGNANSGTRDTALYRQSSGMVGTTNLYVSGLVGIGTNAPAARLHVAGDNSTIHVLKAGTTNRPALLTLTTNGAFALDNITASRVATWHSDKVLTNGATTSALLDNFFAMGITNITNFGSGIVIGTNGGTLTISNSAAGGGDSHAWASNSIPFMNPAGNALVFYNPGNILSNGGFGFHPIGPHGGGAYGGLRVFAPYSSGLLTIGHPNPGSSFATFVTALSVSNAYDGTGFKQEMSKYDATDTGSGSDPSSTFVTYRTWSGSTPTIAAEVRKDGMGFFSHGTMYQSNALAVAAMPTAAELGPGGYWAGVSNTSFVVMHSADGTATSMKVLSP